MIAPVARTNTRLPVKLPVALANLSGEHVQDTELMMAGSVLTILPVMVAFVFLQRFITTGIAGAGIK